MDAVAAGMTPYRPSPLPSPPRVSGADAPGTRAGGTPSCADDLNRLVAAAVRPWRPGAGPERFLAERQPGGWACVGEHRVRPHDHHGIVGRYLAQPEQRAFEQLKPAVRPTWLLGRVAAKDAVRWWLADRGCEVAPDEVLVDNEAGGRPVVRLAVGGPGDGPSALARTWPPPDLRISIAHVSGTGVAIVAEGRDVGIDVEETAPRPGSFARVAFSAGERAERVAATASVGSGPHATMDEVTWMAAAWCAKEAVGKAAGTGLAGRPTRFVTSLVGPDLFAVGEQLVRCLRLDPLRWCSAAGHPLVVGWTLSASGPVDIVVADAADGPGGAVRS